MKVPRPLLTLHHKFNPRIGIVLGSGLSGFTEQLNNRIDISYDDLPGFPKCSVQGQVGRMTFGTLGGTAIVCLQGRSHTYEGQGFEPVKTYVRTLRLLGCEYFIAINASGSMHTDIPPGELVLISDHINLQGSNPLVGPNDDEFGPRFLALNHAYDSSLRKKFLKAASTLKMKLHEGVYLCVTGPNYETAAEIRAFKLLGADVVGMSTVPEVLVANHCGMKVAAIATITNFATGLDNTEHSHEEVVAVAQRTVQKLTPLLLQALPHL